VTILVTGARGTVGSYFARLAPEFGEPIALVAHDDLDIGKLDQVRALLGSKKYRVAINLAAATDLDRAEREPAWAYAVNTLGPWNLALAAREFDVELVQVSTVGMFGADGARGPFSELDPPNPVNVYAKTKLAGETLVRQLWPKSYVVRSSWVMGGGPKDKKFIGMLRDRILRGERVRAVNDKIGSPTYAKDLVLAIGELIATGAYGLYHVTNQGSASRYELATAVNEIVKGGATVEPASSSEFPQPAARPLSEASVSFALPARGIVLPPWREALERYLSDQAWT
jgi:dTDP-4-dehydrorhamnose reductase